MLLSQNVRLTVQKVYVRLTVQKCKSVRLTVQKCMFKLSKSVLLNCAKVYVVV